MYSVEKTKGISITRRFDYLSFFVVLVISAIGILVLSSAAYKMTNGSSLMRTQYISLLIGFILAVFISTIDYKDFKTIGVIFYLFSVLMLVLVLIIGTGDQLGSKSWIKLGNFRFQPSELSKITFVVMASIFLERIKEGTERNKNIIKLIMYSVLPVGLVLLQPDFGTAMVFVFIFLVMIFICGFPYRYIVITSIMCVVSMPFLWFFGLKDYQKKRIMVFLSPELDPKGAGFNVIRAKTAIGSGKLFGKRLYEGIQTQNGGVPVKESDFIFTVVGEELGFVGAVIIIVLMFFLLLRFLYIAKHSRDGYGAFLVTGMVGMIAFHFIQNVGMCIGILPVTGIPLPFISSGGTAMIANYIAVGLVLSVSMRRKKTIFNVDE